MIQVYSAQHPTEAHLVKGMLEAAGIECEVRGELLFSARGELPVTAETAPSVWIKEKARLNTAMKIVALYDQRNKNTVESELFWSCETCGEKHGEQFTHCWNCGVAK